MNSTATKVSAPPAEVRESEDYSISSEKKKIFEYHHLFDYVNSWIIP